MANPTTILSELQWWAVTQGFETGAIDRAVAKFLAELDVPACVRCGGLPLYGDGPYCDPCRQAEGRRRRKARRTP